MLGVRAPMRPVTINNGYVMRAWNDILGAEIGRREDEAGLRYPQRVAGLSRRSPTAHPKRPWRNHCPSPGAAGRRPRHSHTSEPSSAWPMK